MDCQRLTVPEGCRLMGWTATGRRVRIAAGEYLVHRLRPKVPLHGVKEALRFVGADPHGGDVHVPLPPGVDVRDLIGQAASAPAAAAR